jgi:uncharacterized protein YaeQ
MAIGATINKVCLNIADLNRQYYQQHELTLAVHPSENNLRFMVRVIAFALNANERLSFTKGLGSDDEPELWIKSLSDEIELWIDFGQVDEKRVRKACGRSDKVCIYTYQKRKASVWWEQNRQKLSRQNKLTLFHVEAEGADSLVSRSMQLQCTIDGSTIYLSDDNNSCAVSVVMWT